MIVKCMDLYNWIRNKTSGASVEIRLKDGRVIRNFTLKETQAVMLRDGEKIALDRFIEGDRDRLKNSAIDTVLVIEEIEP